MARRTRKVGRSGRLGPRYGLSVRRRTQAIESAQFRRHPCPQCLTGRLKRVSTGIWQCRKCSYKFAGGAYTPNTGKTVETRVAAAAPTPTGTGVMEQPDPEPVEADEPVTDEPEAAAVVVTDDEPAADEPDDEAVDAEPDAEPDETEAPTDDEDVGREEE